MSEQSKTPRTDAIIKAAEDGGETWEDTAVLIARECQQLERELAAMTAKLRDLLAVIHRDGGHHTEAVGLEQSCLDAHAEIARRTMALEAAESRERALREALRALHDDVEGIIDRDSPCLKEARAALAQQPTEREG